MAGRGCDDALTVITLQPGEEKRHEFFPVKLTEAYGPLTITARMIGYDASAVSKTVTVNQTVAIAESTVPEAAIRHCTWQQNTGTVMVWLDRSQTILIEAFTPAGQAVEHGTGECFLPAGVHTIHLNKFHFAHHLLLIRISGNGFSEAKKIFTR
jgi:hypothetical protein